MFYSHQLLARKAPLGQIWMAATMHAKINRRKLDKLDIIQICEEILNPSVPMALRLSGILMGGVVIVYGRKVKLLYDDVTRFLVEINEAWKVKPHVDRTVLPKGKAQAKFEAVTLPAAVDMEVEQTMHFFSDASPTAARFQRMRLDDLDKEFININVRDDDQSHQHHQADAANITLFDDFGSGLAETDLYNRFERFDIGEDEEIQMNFPSQEHPTIVPSPPKEEARSQPPTSLVSSPPTHHEAFAPQYEPTAEEQEGQPEDHTHAAQEAEGAEPERRQQPARRRARRNLPRVVMDEEQLMIPGNIYQMWIQDASSILSKRARNTKPRHPITTSKIDILMDLPPLALMTGLENFPNELHYPAPLLKLWRKCTNAMPAYGSPSGTTPEAQESPQSHSPPQGLSHRGNINPDFPPGDVQSEIGLQPDVSPIERGRAEQANTEFQAIFNDADMGASDHFTTPRSPSGQSSGSIPSSGSGHVFLLHEQEILPTSTRYKKRQQSSARSDLGNLDPVEEEFPMVQDVRGFKIRRLSEDRPPEDSDLIVETGPTQTPHPALIRQPTVDRVTESIRTHLKQHFDTPGNPQSEAIDQLAAGMNRKRAAQLFYQTLVLATMDFVTVHQAEPYAEILVSRGPKM